MHTYPSHLNHKYKDHVVFVACFTSSILIYATYFSFIKKKSDICLPKSDGRCSTKLHKNPLRATKLVVPHIVKAEITLFYGQEHCFRTNYKILKILKALV